MTEKAEMVERHFHRASKEFDSYYNEKKGVFARLIDQAFRKSMRLRYEKVLAEVAPYEGKKVLDVGCGAGRYCIALAARGIKRARGVDFAENMIEEAILLARAFKLEDICMFEKRDFLTMDDGETYDHVFAMGVLDYIENPAVFVQRMVDCAKSSVMVSFPTSRGIIQKFRRFKFEKINKCPIFFYTYDDVERIAREAGCDNIAIENMAKDFFLTIKK